MLEQGIGTAYSFVEFTEQQQQQQNVCDNDNNNDQSKLIDN